MTETLLSVAALTAFLASNPAPSPEDHDPAVERAAREYRLTIYERFRRTRDEYDWHRQAGDELLQSWRNAGQPGLRRPEVLQWYQAATEAVRMGQEAGPLPAQPHFEPAIVSEAPAGLAAGPPAAVLDQETSTALQEAAGMASPQERAWRDERRGPPGLAAPQQATSSGSGSFRVLNSMRRALLRAANFSQ